MNFDQQLNELIETASSKDFIDQMMESDEILTAWMRSGDPEKRQAAMLVKQKQVDAFQKILEREKNEGIV